MHLEKIIYIGTSNNYLFTYGEIYHGMLDRNYYKEAGKNIYWITDYPRIKEDPNPNDIYRGFDASLFITLAEWRDKQINEILKD
jgi:hypothetical protein